MRFKLFGRKINLLQLPDKLAELVGIAFKFRIFRRPYSVFKAYILKKDIPEYLELKTGQRIYLSSHKEDIVTVILVFCKKDYGADFAGRTVIDIGANIGVFSLYAALNGAKKVVAIEPNPEAMETFLTTINYNKLQQITTTIQKAVTANDGRELHFPVKSSPNNKPFETPISADYLQVQTISLPTIMRAHFNTPIDILKIDCEGGEYDILYNLDGQALSAIREIKMELHGSTEQKNDLLSYLQQKGFTLLTYQHDNAWLKNNMA